MIDTDKPEPGNEKAPLRLVDLRAEVRWFAGRMERELAAHERLGGWKSEGSMWLFVRLREELAKLFSAIHAAKIDPERVVKEAADLSNYAMMIADNAMRGRLPAICPDCGGELGQGDKNCGRCMAEAYRHSP